MLGKSPFLEVTRSGIRWRLDLREGIDLSIYLFRTFEPDTVDICTSLLRPGSTAIDIGANIGAHTLHLARAVGEEGRLIAYEPTDYAFSKLKTNIALNPALASRIEAFQAALLGEDDEKVPAQFYSSWPLDRVDGLHGLHCGKLTPAVRAFGTTLDRHLAERAVSRVDLIKLDVDGHEPTVLHGAQRTIEIHRPPILLELAPYLHESDPKAFNELLSSLSRFGYKIFRVPGGGELPLNPESLRTTVRRGASINVLARAE